MVPDETGTESA